MLRLCNQTPFPAALFAGVDLDGCEHGVVAAKATYDVRADGRVELSKEQRPLRLADVPHPDPTIASLWAEADTAPRKVGTDVVLVGHAEAGGQASVDVVLRVADRHRTLRIFGHREWVATDRGYQPSAPRPFDRLPIVYDLAFGGADPRRPDGARWAENPVGRGRLERDVQGEIAGFPLPNIELADQLMTHPFAEPEVAGFGPIARHWEPRRSRAGTYDEAWARERCPMWPHDFDLLHHSVAHPSFHFHEPLQGGEHIQVAGTRIASEFSLPREVLRFRSSVRGQVVELLPRIDTVFIDADASQVELTHRAYVPCGASLLNLEWVRLRRDPGEAA